ncbi:hypothetical protein [Roseateles aquatilis]|uniref:hypothetical protein n=1 Tax=Roseateles aquatilis TaxID=431061 RepID=UPI001132078D|nr:hypothetical protein [Roseateles aquatilis]
MKTNEFAPNRNLLNSIFAHDPITKNILSFLRTSEHIGLALLNKETKDFVYTRLLGEHYDPFATSQWHSLGTSGRHTVDQNAVYDDDFILMRAGIVAEIAKYSKMAWHHMIESLAQQTIVQLESQESTIYVELNWQLQNTPQIPQYVNCKAVLKIGQKTAFALNFINGEKLSEIAIEFFKANQGLPTGQSMYGAVAARHAELRLTNRLVLGVATPSPRLSIDKYCCVFCAVQLTALGYQHLVPGWRAGELKWYTFLPAVVYFADKRKAIWGEAVEKFFCSLSAGERLDFLIALVEQTKGAADTSPHSLRASREEEYFGARFSS